MREIGQTSACSRGRIHISPPSGVVSGEAAGTFPKHPSRSQAGMLLCGKWGEGVRLVACEPWRRTMEMRGKNSSTGGITQAESLRLNVTSSRGWISPRSPCHAADVLCTFPSLY